MMAVEVGGEVYEIEGVLVRGMAACTLRKAGGRPIAADDFELLAETDRAMLLDLLTRHIEAVALLADNRLARGGGAHARTGGGAP